MHEVGVNTSSDIETQRRGVVHLYCFLPEQSEDVHHFYYVLAGRSCRVDVCVVVDKVESDGTILVRLQPPAGNSVVDGYQFLVFDYFVVDAAGVPLDEGDRG